MVGAAVLPAANLVKSWQEQRSKNQVEVRGLAAGPAGFVPDQSVGNVRVHRAVRDDVPYVKRDDEEKAIEWLRRDRRVLIAGEPMSGKTRLALQVATAVVGDYVWYEPADGKSLHELWVKGMKTDRVVVWLDDLERFTGASGLSGTDLGGR